MIITAFGIPIDISDINIRVFKKMHHTDIDSTDVEMYLDAYYRMEPEELISIFSSQELSATANYSIRKEAMECYGEDFYRSE